MTQKDFLDEMVSARTNRNTSFPQLVSAAASMLGRRGGLKGGPARAAKLTAARRSEIAHKAAEARWRST